MLVLFLFSLFVTETFGLHCFSCKHFLRDKDGKCALFPKIPKETVDLSKKKKEIDYFYSSTAREFKDMCGEKATKYA
jgi:hypothetical protein